VLSWGGTFGACATAVRQAANEGLSVGHAHLRYLNPFPSNLGEVIKRFKKVLVPELNKGQLRMLVRSEFLVDAIGLNKVQGKPFAVWEVVEKIQQILTPDKVTAGAARRQMQKVKSESVGDGG